MPLGLLTRWKTATTEETAHSITLWLPSQKMGCALAFMGVWLTGWTFGGVITWGALFSGAAPGTRAFLALWLAGWAVGEAAAGYTVLWQLFGQEALHLTRDTMATWRQLGPVRHGYTVHPMDAIRALTLSPAQALPLPGGGDDGKEAAPQGQLLLHRTTGEPIALGAGLTRQQAMALLAHLHTRAFLPPRLWDEPGTS